MKPKIQRATLVVVLALPLALLWAGCKPAAEPTPTESAPVPRQTNAAVTPDADNTRVNVRDRNDATLTPDDQGGTPADREITQKIRKAITMDTSGYSVPARNIKIVTVNGKVTLRGPVNSSAEKTSVVRLAQTVAGEGNVEDQLEVKVNP